MTDHEALKMAARDYLNSDRRESVARLERGDALDTLKQWMQDTDCRAIRLGSNMMIWSACDGSFTTYSDITDLGEP